MTWSRTLELSPKKFDNLTSTYGQILSYAILCPGSKNWIYYFLGVVFYYGHFKPISDE
jgi:hypothetical protein